MKVDFRQMNESDIEETIKLCNLCFDENTNFEDALNVYKKNAIDKTCFYIVGCTEDKKIIAHVRLQFIETMYASMRGYAILNHVCVHPNYRRHKIGTELLTYVSNICRQKNIAEMKLWSNNYRVSSHALYKSFGFDPVDATFYTKKIN